jgi:oligopeptide/dipeptide ABC transporter ATP-binding protein
MTETDLLVEMKNLHTHFFLAEGVVRAVDGVDMKIRRGQTIGVVGESGCGKSVTSLSLMGLLPPSAKVVEGELLFYKQDDNQVGDRSTVSCVDIAKLPQDSREIRSIRGNEISMVFQEPMTAMIPIRTIGYQISEAIMLHRGVNKETAREMTIDILRRVRMPRPEKVVDDYPFQLSGGMRQRAVIAMALSCNPSLLIADEPTTALDVTTEAQILDLMRALQNDLGMAIMYITHNLGVVAEMAQEVAVMYLGKVVEHTDVQSIFFEPLHPYTRGLLSSIPHLDESIYNPNRTRRLNTIKGMVPDPYQRLPGCPFHPRCPEFMPGLCDKIVPPEIMTKPGHMVRCLLYGGAESEDIAKVNYADHTT